MTMMDQSVNEWNYLRSLSVRFISGYLPRVSCAVCASDPNMRAMAELNGPVYEEMKKMTNYEGLYKEHGAPSFSGESKSTTEKVEVRCRSHAVQFVYESAACAETCIDEYEQYQDYAVCVVDVADVHAVEMVIWWLQMAAVRAVRLVGAEYLSHDGLQRVLTLLTSAKCLISTGTALSAALEEFTCDGFSLFSSIMLNNMNTLQQCQCLKRIHLDCCRHLDSLVGIEGLRSLEALFVTYAKISSVAPLQECYGLKSLCLSGCMRLRSIVGVEKLHRLTILNINNTSVESLTPLRDCAQLMRVFIGNCSQLHSLDGLQEKRFLEKILVTQAMSKMDKSAIPVHRQYIVEYF